MPHRARSCALACEGSGRSRNPRRAPGSDGGRRARRRAQRRAALAWLARCGVGSSARCSRGPAAASRRGGGRRASSCSRFPRSRTAASFLFRGEARHVLRRRRRARQPAPAARSAPDRRDLADERLPHRSGRALARRSCSSLLVVAPATAGLVRSLRRPRRAWAALAYVVTSLVGASRHLRPPARRGSTGKALAIGLAGRPLRRAARLCVDPRSASARCGGRRRGGVIAGGVLWSNGLAYHGATLAPHDQLAELEEIGERFAGQGPALMTEYQPYGVRHFLRRLDAEGASELRRRPVPKVDGSLPQKGEAPDLDELALPGVLVYRTLVLRRSPVASRPPAPYELRWQGRWYEVWQRPLRRQRPSPRTFRSATRATPAAAPGCADVLGIARKAKTIATVVARAAGGRAPRAAVGGRGGFVVPQTGRYSLWLGRVTARRGRRVHGRAAHRAARRRTSTGRSQYTDLGSAVLARGVHTVRVAVRAGTARAGDGRPGIRTRPARGHPRRSATERDDRRTRRSRAGCAAGRSTGSRRSADRRTAPS